MKSYTKIGAVQKSIEIMKFMAREVQPVSPTEISNAVGIPFHTVMSHLATLEDDGLVQKVYERYAKIADVIDKEKMENYQYDRDIKVLTAQNKEIVYKKTELRAPYDLVVTKKMTELGNIVLGSQTKLLTVESTHDVKLVIKFDEKYWNTVKVGQKFTYKVDGSDKTYEGVISKIYPTVLTSTREMQAEVKAKDLIPGLFGNGMIKAE